MKDFAYKDFSSVEDVFVTLNEDRLRRMLRYNEAIDIGRIALNQQFWSEKKAVESVRKYFLEPNMPPVAPPTCNCPVANDTRWHEVDKGTPLSWYYDPDGERFNYEAIIRQCMGHTSEKADIKFVRRDNPDDAEIVITNGAIDGAGGTLGATWYPASGDKMSACGPRCGDITMDIGERWTYRFFRAVFLHELGHAIGLRHSKSPFDVMFAQFRGYQIWQVPDIRELIVRYPFELTA